MILTDRSRRRLHTPHADPARPRARRDGGPRRPRPDPGRPPGGVKAEYGDYFDAVLPLLGEGAVLAVDNVLMSGAVAQADQTERLSQAWAFSERLLGHRELTGTLTPVGDGVLNAVMK